MIVKQMLHHVTTPLINCCLWLVMCNLYFLQHNWKFICTNCCMCSKVNKRIVKKHCQPVQAKRLTSNAYLNQTLNLETRKVQLMRQSLQLKRRKVAALEKIASELAGLHSSYNVVHDIVVVSSLSCDAAEQ